MNLPERIKHLADSATAVIEGWKTRQPKEKVWNSIITVGLWMMASVRVEEKDNGSLLVVSEGLVMYVDNGLTRERESGMTDAGRVSLDAENALNFVRDCGVGSLETLKAVLQDSVMETMAAGVPADECIEIAKIAVIQDVMRT